MWDAIVIGSGIAGMTAGAAAAKLDQRVLSREWETVRPTQRPPMMQ